jgi:hypothetical protein
MFFQLFKNVYRNAALQKKSAGNCHILADSRWEMLLKVVGQPLGNALEGCWTAAGKCPKAIGKPLGNS